MNNSICLLHMCEPEKKKKNSYVHICMCVCVNLARKSKPILFPHLHNEMVQGAREMVKNIQFSHIPSWLFVWLVNIVCVSVGHVFFIWRRRKMKIESPKLDILEADSYCKFKRNTKSLSIGFIWDSIFDFFFFLFQFPREQ